MTVPQGLLKSLLEAERAATEAGIEEARAYRAWSLARDKRNNFQGALNVKVAAVVAALESLPGDKP